MKRIVFGLIVALAGACGSDGGSTGSAGGTGGQAGAGGSGGLGGAAGAGGASGGSAGATTLVSALSDCGTVTAPCFTLDLGAPSHTISRDLFGDGIEWSARGLDVLAPDPTGQTPGSLRADVMQALGELGLTQMRYPGGTLSDAFHWSEAIGPVAGRKPQRTLSVDSSTNQLVEELPLFGPDEFVAFSQQLGTEILLTVNVMTGTADEAAGWVSYWKGKGIKPSYVEIGNEAYLPLVDAKVMPALTPSEYAKRFDEFATAIRAVDPSLRLGAIGTMDTSSWCYPSCTTPAPWNQVVLQAIQQKADFFSVHNAYAPGSSTDDLATFEAMLAYPEHIRLDDSLLEADIELFANSESKKMPLARTEFASFFVPPPGADLATIKTIVGRNQTWAAALYSGLVLQASIANPRVTVANHINPLHYLWQAPIAVEFPDAATYPASYQPKPTISAYGLVFQAYRELAGQRYVSAKSSNVPTMSTKAVGIAPAQVDVPLVDAVGALNAVADPARGWLFLVNRSLDQTLEVSIVLENIPQGASTLEMDALTTSDYLAKNSPGQPPAVTWKPLVSGQLPATSTPFGLTLTLPKHSLVRVRVHG